MPTKSEPATLSEDECLADDLLAKVAAARGIPPRDVLAQAAQAASLDGRSECLQPHEIEDVDALSGSLREHVEGCLFCQRLLQGSVPDRDDAALFAAQAMRTARRALVLRTVLEVVRVPPTWIRERIHRLFNRAPAPNGNGAHLS